MTLRDERALREIIRLCDLGSQLVARGRDWYHGDDINTPGLAAESIIVKIGENVARLSDETTAANPTVPWSSIKRMRDRLARHHEGTDYEALWDTLAIDLPAIRAQIAAVREGEPG